MNPSDAIAYIKCRIAAWKQSRNAERDAMCARFEARMNELGKTLPDQTDDANWGYTPSWLTRHWKKLVVAAAIVVGLVIFSKCSGVPSAASDLWDGTSNKSTICSMYNSDSGGTVSQYTYAANHKGYSVDKNDVRALLADKCN